MATRYRWWKEEENIWSKECDRDEVQRQIRMGFIGPATILERTDENGSRFVRPAGCFSAYWSIPGESKTLKFAELENHVRKSDGELNEVRWVGKPFNPQEIIESVRKASLRADQLTKETGQAGANAPAETQSEVGPDTSEAEIGLQDSSETVAGAEQAVVPPVAKAADKPEPAKTDSAKTEAAEAEAAETEAMEDAPPEAVEAQKVAPPEAPAAADANGDDAGTPAPIAPVAQTADAQAQAQVAPIPVGAAVPAAAPVPMLDEFTAAPRYETPPKQTAAAPAVPAPAPPRAEAECWPAVWRS